MVYKGCVYSLGSWDEVMRTEVISVSCTALCGPQLSPGHIEARLECLLTRYTTTGGLRLSVTKKLTMCGCCLHIHFFYFNILKNKSFERKWY